ncbi:hypothetical protein [Burkholderia ubonensis]|uniref:hypothetical protein n=1 Tax=Burkholderia ubonensis TaxID=101571 RepID=UPI00076DD02E|nr:hypothetical protein [Burkholderia ubonensis]KWB79377.1 hypothetical protein WL42_12490 [Burkholderia ubonensis]
MRRLFRSKEQLIASIAVLALAGWTVWYAVAGVYRDLPRGQCVIRQPRWTVSVNGAQRQAVLSTSFWFDTGRMHVQGCFQRERQSLSIDRNGSLQLLFHGNGTVLGRVSHVAYSRLDDAASTPVPIPLAGDGQELHLRFRRLAPNAWIVETDDSYAGMCLTD